MLLLITLQDILFTSYRFVLTKFCMKNLDFKLIIFFLQISTVKPSIYFRYRQVHKNRIQNHFLSSFSFCFSVQNINAWCSFNYLFLRWKETKLCRLFIWQQKKYATFIFKQLFSSDTRMLEYNCLRQLYWNLKYAFVYFYWFFLCKTAKYFH